MADYRIASDPLTHKTVKVFSMADGTDITGTLERIDQTTKFFVVRCIHPDYGPVFLELNPQLILAIAPCVEDAEDDLQDPDHRPFRNDLALTDLADGCTVVSYRGEVLATFFSSVSAEMFQAGVQRGLALAGIEAEVIR